MTCGRAALVHVSHLYPKSGIKATVVICFRHFQQVGNSAQHHHFAHRHIQTDNGFVDIGGFYMSKKGIGVDDLNRLKRLGFSCK